MKKAFLYTFLTFGLILTGCKTEKKPVEEKTQQATAEWKTGIQTYSFHKFTLTEALEKTQGLGLKYAEAYFGQSLGTGFQDTAYLDYSLTNDVRLQLKNEFDKRNIKLYAFGVAMYDKEEDWTKFFEFAKDMGCAMVTCEPKLEHLDFVQQLALKHGIEVAIHNHPEGSIYAHPEVLIKALEGRDPIMGICADPGHWKRMGYDPVVTLKKFNGRIKCIHFKDLNDKMEDTIWGKGVLQAEKMIEELKAQNFKGLVSVEYENFSDSQEADMRKSLDYYNQRIK